MNFQIGQRVWLNDRRNTEHGKPGTITGFKNRGRNRIEMQLDNEKYAYWYREAELLDADPHEHYEPDKDPMRPTPRPEPKPKPAPVMFDDISSGLGIGGAGSDDYNIRTEADHLGSHYDRNSYQEGDWVCPAGTTQGTRAADNDRCSYPGCYRHGDWNPGAGRLFCSRHWDEY